MTILNKVSNKTLMPGITAIPDVPDAPTIGAATAVSDTTATIAYTAATTGGTATTFTATSTPGSLTATGTSPITVTGLTGSTSYTFKVKGTNTTATGPESSASSSITTLQSTAFDLIQSQTLASASTLIDFTSIPSTYKHLEIRAVFQGTQNTDRGNSWEVMRLNGGTSDLWAFIQMKSADGTSVNINAVTNDTAFYLGDMMYQGGNTNVYQFCYLRLNDYANTSTYKEFTLYSGWANSTASQNFTTMVTGTWKYTSAINRVSFPNANTSGFAVGSSVQLYGIKG